MGNGDASCSGPHEQPGPSKEGPNGSSSNKENCSFKLLKLLSHIQKLP